MKALNGLKVLDLSRVLAKALSPFKQAGFDRGRTF